MLVYPNEFTLPLMPNFGLPPPPQGMLHIKVGVPGLAWIHGGEVVVLTSRRLPSCTRGMAGRRMSGEDLHAGPPPCIMTPPPTHF